VDSVSVVAVGIVLVDPIVLEDMIASVVVLDERVAVVD